jgi:hypothetical protein
MGRTKKGQQREFMLMGMCEWNKKNPKIMHYKTLSSSLGFLLATPSNPH